MAGSAPNRQRLERPRLSGKLDADHFRPGELVVEVLLDRETSMTVVEGRRAKYWAGLGAGMDTRPLGDLWSMDIRHDEGQGCAACDEDRPKLIAWHRAHARAWRYAEELAGWRLPYLLDGYSTWAEGSTGTEKWDAGPATLNWPTLFTRHPDMFVPIQPADSKFQNNIRWDRPDVVAAYAQQSTGEGSCPASIVDVFFTDTGAISVALCELFIAN